MSGAIEDWINPQASPKSPDPTIEKASDPVQEPKQTYDTVMRGLSHSAAIEYCAQNLKTHPDEHLWVCKETGKDTYVILRENEV